MVTLSRQTKSIEATANNGNWRLYPGLSTHGAGTSIINSTEDMFLTNVEFLMSRTGTIANPITIRIYNSAETLLYESPEFNPMNISTSLTFVSFPIPTFRLYKNTTYIIMLHFIGIDISNMITMRYKSSADTIYDFKYFDLTDAFVTETTLTIAFKVRYKTKIRPKITNIIYKRKKGINK